MARTECRKRELVGVALPPNPGHMTRVYKAVMPGLRSRIMEWIYRSGTECDWGFEGGGLVLPTVEYPDGRGLSARVASRIGGKTVNQDAAGWRVAGQGGDVLAVVSVADGVTSSLYSEFGAAVAVAAGLWAGTRWLEDGGGRPLAAAVLDGMDEARAAMQAVVREVRAALQGVLTEDVSAVGRVARDESLRQLDLLADPEREPLCTTALLLVTGMGRVAGVAVGNGGIYRVRGHDVQGIWWDMGSDGISSHVGPWDRPAGVTFEFEESQGTGLSDGYGVVTDGVGGFEAFRRERSRFLEGCPVGVLLDNLLADMKKRKVSADLIDNLAIGEIRSHVRPV